MTEFDLVVRRGTVVTAGGRSNCDVAVRDGKIAQLGGSPRGATEVDASGAYVLPGGVDMHVHLAASAPQPGDEPGFVDDFDTGSRAALAGGVTTLGNMTFPDDGQTLHEAIDRDLAAARAQASVDYVLHAGMFTATAAMLDEIPRLAAQRHMGLKVITLAFDHDPSHLIAAVKRAGDAGMLTMVHCEDEALIQYVTGDLVATGRGDLAHYPASRPDYTEAVAVERAVAICEATGAPICIVHLSSASALAAARRARARGLPVYVETRPLYLLLTADVHAEPDSGRYVGMPPVRQRADVDALWRGLADGTIQTVATDHAPWFLADKIAPELDVASSRKGIAELETMIPMLYDEGVRAGRLTLERLVAVTSTNAALLNGLYPRKGTIAVGSDADLLVLDPDLRRTVDGATMQSRAGYSVYDGREVTGWPRYTISRGEVVYADGKVTAQPGHGQWLPRGPVQAP